MKLLLAVIFYFLSNLAFAEEFVTSEQAYRMVEQELRSDRQHDFVITQTAEYEFGWVFHYVPRRYSETRDSRDLVPGSTPLVVNRDGKLESLCDAMTETDVGIAEYLKKWRQKHPTR